MSRPSFKSSAFLLPLKMNHTTYDSYNICLMIATEDNAERLPGLYVLFLSFGFTDRIEQIYGFNRILLDTKMVFLASTATAGA